MSAISAPPHTPPSSAGLPCSSDFLGLPPSPPSSLKNASATTRINTPPPSPTAVDRVLAYLRQLRAGDPSLFTRPRSFRLDPDEYTELQRRIAQEGDFGGWFTDKVRFDYSHGRWSLRMPSAVHERVIACVEDAIAQAVDDLANRLDRRARKEDATAARELRGLYKGRSATVNLYEQPDVKSEADTDAEDEAISTTRCPDATFFHRGSEQANYPTLVLEVSYSQQRKHLPRLADNYIIGSRHAIRCVLGLDLSYTRARSSFSGSDRSASLSIWRADVEKDEEDGEPIGICACHLDADPVRSTSGDACDGKLQLTLADLLPPVIVDTLPTHILEEHLTIPYALISDFIADAELTASSSGTTATPSSGTSTPRKIAKFRKRKRTPSEDELDYDREVMYAEIERRDRERTERGDDDWRAKSRRRTSRRTNTTERKHSLDSLTAASDDLISNVAVHGRRRSGRRSSGMVKTEEMG